MGITGATVVNFSDHHHQETVARLQQQAMHTQPGELGNHAADDDDDGDYVCAQSKKKKISYFSPTFLLLCLSILFVESTPAAPGRR